MTSAVLFDLLILAIPILFALLGAKRGLILTLCSLVALVVALVGAAFLSDAAAPYVAGVVEPRLAQTIQTELEERAGEAGDAWALEESAGQVLAALRERGGVYAQAADKLEETLTAGLAQTAAEAAGIAAATVAGQVARGIIFLIAFLLILILCTLLIHALDLVAKLPGLNALNSLGGGLLGLVKGIVLAYVAVWALCDLTTTIPPETVEQTRLIRLLAEHSPMELLSMAGLSAK